MTQMTNEPQTKIVKSYHGGCFCGAVELRVTGSPVAMGFCHCESCRHWSAAPINAFSLWKPENVEVTKGRDQLLGFTKTPKSDRKSCKRCGGHVLTEHPHWGLVDVYSAVIPSFAFAPGVHVNYGERVVRIVDGLPKQRDLPAEMGGTGTLIAE